MFWDWKLHNCYWYRLLLQMKAYLLGRNEPGTMSIHANFSWCAIHSRRTSLHFDPRARNITTIGTSRIEYEFIMIALWICYAITSVKFVALFECLFCSVHLGDACTPACMVWNITKICTTTLGCVTIPWSCARVSFKAALVEDTCFTFKLPFATAPFLISVRLA